MVRVTVVLLVLAAALPAVAGDGFVLGLELVLPPVQLPLDLRQGEPPSLVAADRELRIALWESPLGRVSYALGAEQAMLGREGLVHGGHMLGAGMTLQALGGAPATEGLMLPSKERPWREFSTREKIETVAYGGVLAAIVWQLIEQAD